MKQQFQILTQLPAILKEEEDEAFKNEAGEIETDDIINKQHNSAVRTIAIGHIVEKVNITYNFTCTGFHKNMESPRKCSNAKT